MQDLAGNDAATFGAQTVTVAPSITSVALTSDPGTDSTYAIGDAITATVTFSAAVDVDESGGTPYVALARGRGTQPERGELRDGRRRDHGRVHLHGGRER